MKRYNITDYHSPEMSENKDGKYVEWVDVAELRHELWEWYYNAVSEAHWLTEESDKKFREILNNIGE